MNPGLRPFNCKIVRVCGSTFSLRRFARHCEAFQIACWVVLRQYLADDDLIAKPYTDLEYKTLGRGAAFGPSRTVYRDALNALMKLGLVDEALDLVFDEWMAIRNYALDIPARTST